MSQEEVALPNLDEDPVDGEDYTNDQFCETNLEALHTMSTHMNQRRDQIEMNGPHSPCSVQDSLLGQDQGRHQQQRGKKRKINFDDQTQLSPK
jgi:hypothetical protein